MNVPNDKEFTALALAEMPDDQAAKIIFDIITLANPPNDKMISHQYKKGNNKKLKNKDNNAGNVERKDENLDVDVEETKTASHRSIFMIGLIPFILGLVICITTFIIQSVGLGLAPQREFDPNDESIQETYIEGEYFTTTSIIMYAILTISLICCSLYIREDENHLMEILYTLMAIVECFSIENLITIVLKLSVAKLRPDFLDRCQPDENLNCTNDDIDIIEVGRVSFPSQHASNSAFIGIISISYFIYFMTCFIKNRSLKDKVKIITLMILGSIILLSPSIIISVTRYTDHKHFPIDIGVGYLIGFAFGFVEIFLYLMLSRKFRYSKWSDLRLHWHLKGSRTRKNKSLDILENQRKPTSTDAILSCAYTKSNKASINPGIKEVGLTEEGYLHDTQFEGKHKEGKGLDMDDPDSSHIEVDELGK